MPSLPLPVGLIHGVLLHISQTLQRRLYMHDLTVTEEEINNIFYSAEDRATIQRAGRLTGRHMLSPTITVYFRHPTRENTSIPVGFYGSFIAHDAGAYGEGPNHRVRPVQDDPEARRTFEAIREYAYKQWRLKVEHQYVSDILAYIFGTRITNSGRRPRGLQPDSRIIGSTGGLYAMWPGIAPLFENKDPKLMSEAARAVGRVSPLWDNDCKQAAARVEQLFAYASTLPAEDTRTPLARSARIDPASGDVPPWPP